MLLAGAYRSAEEIAPGNESSACVATARIFEVGGPFWP